eukprot:c8438_g1_i2.p1 GENE.c8438_g1_i2~~c8438_g1_i2.p1  ORF type:complete len:284 (-),score=37.22 c8438_g1_i2:24-875(-)
MHMLPIAEKTIQSSSNPSLASDVQAVRTRGEIVGCFGTTFDITNPAPGTKTKQAGLFELRENDQVSITEFSIDSVSRTIAEFGEIEHRPQPTPSAGTDRIKPVCIVRLGEIVEHTIEISGWYRLTAKGAMGGDGDTTKGGGGAIVTGTFLLAQRDKLLIFCGVAGRQATEGWGSGGGDGTFVSVQKRESFLIVAGGGGGAAKMDGLDASTEPNDRFGVGSAKPAGKFGSASFGYGGVYSGAGSGSGGGGGSSFVHANVRGVVKQTGNREQASVLIRFAGVNVN